ncbi:MAG: helix-turn-helix transcriptional regulator [Sphingobacterium sp.]|nr:helix-turn-helix transcriptional regulator [Sphingobacterium sp.]
MLAMNYRGLTDVISGLMAAVERKQHIQDNEQSLMLQACLQQLFLVIRRLIETSDEHDAESGSAAGHLRKLKQIIQRKAGLVTVEELAVQMNLSAAHLNRISRQLTGLSVSDLIADQVVIEAKKLLLYTNLTVAEIDYKLNFDYPNYFARFFRLHTGASPKAFHSRKTT